jgi:hypothetical protein
MNNPNGNAPQADSAEARKAEYAADEAKGASKPAATTAPGGAVNMLPTVNPSSKPAVNATPSSPLSVAAKIAAAHNAGVTGRPAPTATAAAPAQPAPKPKVTPNVPLPAAAKSRLPASKAPTAPLIGGNSGTNQPFADLMSRAAELGTTAAKGRNTQVQFHLMVTDAAFAGTIDLTTNKHGPDRDDALILSEAYVRAQNTAAIFDPKAPNQRKATSLVRTCIKLGHYRPIKGGGSGEPMRTVNALMGAWQAARQSPAKKNSKKLDDATNTLMRYARAQLRDDKLIPDSRFPEFMFRKDKDSPDAEELVARARDALGKLINGKAAGGTATDDSDEVKNAHQWLTVRLAKIAEDKGAQNNPATP